MPSKDASMPDAVSADAVSILLNTGKLLLPPISDPSGGVRVLLPRDWRTEHVAPVDRVLTHIKQKVSVLDTASFVAYVNRFKSEKTTIFADYHQPIVTAYIDYHDTLKPDYLAHSVGFVPPWSEQWARWRGIDGKRLSQLEFAEFLEENIADIVAPEGGAFLDLVTGLQAKKKVSFESGIRLHDGSNQLSYQEEVESKGRGTMTMPSDFSIGMPVFFGGEGYRIRCLLRYRIEDSKLYFIVKINRRLFVEQTAFADITKLIADQTTLAILNGGA